MILSFVAHSKTDQDGLDFIFHVLGERYKGFSMPEVVKWFCLIETICFCGRVVAQAE